MVTLRQPLTLAECQLVREWRNAPDVLPMLRTGFKTEEEQEQFYWRVIQSPQSRHRYYAIERDSEFVGMGGLTHRRWRGAEISLILAPAHRRHGIGREAVALLLEEADGLGLKRVTGECYQDNPAAEFWARLVAESGAFVKGNRYKWTWR
jgi:RimJ/RimL family protein N-acetyltransferase